LCFIEGAVNLIHSLNTAQTTMLDPSSNVAKQLRDKKRFKRAAIEKKKTNKMMEDVVCQVLPSFEERKIDDKVKDYIEKSKNFHRHDLNKEESDNQTDNAKNSSELFAKDGERCGYLNFEDEEILQKMDDVTETMSALK